MTIAGIGLTLLIGPAVPAPAPAGGANSSDSGTTLVPSSSG